MLYFLQGLTLGLAYVAPIGVQNLFIINSSIMRSRVKAYQTAFIVIFFDITLAMACFFGIGFLMDRFYLLKMIILLIGCIVVIIMGIKLITEKTDLDNSRDVNISMVKVIGMACVVTWFNPQALIDGSLLLGAFRATLPIESSTRFILGVACASCLWFLTLTTVTILFRKKFSSKVLRYINILCGIIIFAYGLKLGWSFYKML
ncbi:LysE/ArgO family amino acid transporter [Anaerovorax odorimutans]|uniref:LysE/ArgO family amino acid transporter n=1 Tax=Anaerovorax odorimutans TaxID=109327 RepID=UPI000420C8B2|nr:LysE family transporter [Anaerovorax odorimutans]